MANKLVVSLSPHVHSGDSVKKNMYGVIIALFPALLVSLYVFGLGAAIVISTSIASCVFFEWAITKYLLKRDKTTITDGSAIVTGLLLGFNLPSNLPVWMIIIGALIAIGIAKMTFGGLGCNPFNPALVARAVLLISFPVAMTTWPKAFQALAYTDADTCATPLAIMQQAIKDNDANVLDQLPNSLDMLFGTISGSIGEVSAIALLVGFAFLVWRKIITWHIPVVIIGTVFIFSTLLHLANPIYADPFTQVMSGGLLLGAIFMATDYVTSPMNIRGQILYAFFIGFLTVIIRNFGAYPEGMSFAILIMNAFTPLINNYCKPIRFGEEVTK